MKNQIAVELKYLLKKHGLTERYSLKKIMGNEISRKESEFLIGLVLDEFCEFELDSDSEPTERGLFLEDIVDFLNRPFLE